MTRAAGRIEAVDALRGLIMLLMALDHAADFVAGHHASEFWGVPVPEHPSALSFTTRLVTHLCAPGFAFLMGMGMMLFADARRARGWSEARITAHFALRGLVLVVVDTLLVSPVFLLATLDGEPTVPGHVWPGAGPDIRIGFGVLSALGFAMAVGGVLARLGPWGCALVGLAIAVVSQVTVPGDVDAAVGYAARVLWIPGQSGSLIVPYSLLPWLGVCALGMAVGPLLRRAPERFLRLTPWVGAAALVLFVAVRGAGGFGNTHPPAGSDWISLLSVTKYPPSIAFLLLTLGTDAVVLGAFAALSGDRGRLGPWAGPLLVLGRTPLFFYVLHLWVYAAIGAAIPGDTSLPWMYPWWLLGVGALLPACARYARFKDATPADSVWRLF